MSYASFLASKTTAAPAVGQAVARTALHPTLTDWQADITGWAIRTGRAAIWADTGMGKTLMAGEWARHSGATTLITAPLAVCFQTAPEVGEKLGLPATYVRDQSEITGPGLYLTNYERVSGFDPARLDAVVLDESSILKASTGKTRTMLINHFRDVPRRLSCTATPAPNDPEELTSQAEFLGTCSRVDMLATYFIHDDQGWRLKRHAVGPMYRWLATWAIALRRPSDLGYSDVGFELPGLDVMPEVVAADLAVPDGALFAVAPGGVTGRAKVRRDTLRARVERTAELVHAEHDEAWALWCGLNEEAELLAELVPGAVNVHGGMKAEAKAEALLAFARGEIRHLITKPKIAGFGMNWQHCSRLAFVGLSDSFETYYQTIRRFWRTGQRRDVRAHVVLSDAEQHIARNVARKATASSALTDGLVAAMRDAHYLQEAAA